MKEATKKLHGLFFTFMIAFTMAHAQQPDSPLTTWQSSQEAPASQFPGTSDYANINLSYKIIDVFNNTFGYDVSVHDRLMIHQSSVPGLPGNEGFKTKNDAQIVAQLVIEKIKKGEMPPTVSIEEMKTLNVIK